MDYRYRCLRHLVLAVLVEHQLVTDERTNRRTDTMTVYMPTALAKRRAIKGRLKCAMACRSKPCRQCNKLFFMSKCTLWLKVSGSEVLNSLALGTSPQSLS